jgi:ATP-dependent exoDNAse (exonuclease V) beta subunit
MVFTDEDHMYVHEGHVYTSVTTLVKQFVKKKDWEVIAEKYAAKNGETAEYWLKKWDDHKRHKAEKGSRYHKIREDTTEGIDCPVIDGKKHAIDLKGLDGVYKELIIFDPLYRVAGQIDYLKVTNGLCHIVDYKTSKDISNEAPVVGFNRTTRKPIKPHFLTPISALEETTYNTYALQLSVYAFMLERRGYKIGNLKIEHVLFNTDDLDDLVPKEIVPYDMPYLKTHAKSILTWNKDSLNL